MGRLSRAELQQRNRARVLAAARDEFAERGFRDAKVDGIAGRAGLTRGAVYSNFPGKRALYFAVLADLAEHAPAPALTPSHPDHEPERSPTPRDALGALARAWVARLPLTETGAHEPHGAARLGTHVMPEILAEERIQRPFAQLMKLDAILLGLALEGLAPERPHPPAAPPATRPGRPRQVRVAEAALTTLYGAGQLAAAAPGFVDPFNVISACEQLADVDLGDVWPPPHLPYIPQARPADAPWSPPPAFDAVRGEPARLTDDGIVAVLGLHRLEAAEEAVRAAPPGAKVTAVLVTGDPDELTPLARLVVADLANCLRQAFPPSAWPRLQVVYDESGDLAAAAGVPAVSDGTEAAVRIEAARIIARADGRGACHAAAASAAAADARA
ncbi:TetR/AcrR family transcriptional regulator [Streptomyces sp. ISL-98]|uniref:TetR/AcrR family transcriptional regulator n=1 Tax=Streptomyces sp. ISL-98 TaxID=2819192 RepID=UPI001BE5A602|nr:TetR/AcrR family transcriptional regulator [Streptomyces sp. ISL-98]MBT2506121.1 TetR/AcrR family transcriptional regulator [Streptomyces sp. ISL-98]